MHDEARSSKLSDFEFSIYRKLQAMAGVPQSKIIVACSGGVDSIALLHVLAVVAPKLALTLEVAHVHHGLGETEVQTLARDQARDLVRTLAAKLDLPVTVIQPPSEKRFTSEEDLRDFRLDTLAELQNAKGFDFVALAHHADDVFETRLMRLIRGTGAQGLKAMSELDESTTGHGRFRKLRPFFDETRSSIRSYADQKKLEWREDPSNSETRYFRNWLRNEWLPQLEAKRSGSLVAFARSLESLVADLDCAPLAPETFDTSLNIALGKLGRSAFEGLVPVRKRTVIANLTRALGVRDFSLARVEEVIKRLHHLESTGQKVARFDVGGLIWAISVTEIEAKLK